jgi:hypothetical protein
LYSLEGGDKYYFKWWVVSSDQRQEWREEILKVATDSVEESGFGQAAVEMEQLRAREMLLCDFEDKGSNFLYSLGQTDTVYFKSQWWTVSSDQR